jgi:hypothetical protein
MIRIGDKWLTFRLSAVVNGRLTSLDPTELKGGWVALCFVPSLRPREIEILNHHVEMMNRRAVTLLVVPPSNRSSYSIHSLDV